MDIERFDAIVKELSTGASRRRLLAGLALGGLLTRPPFTDMYVGLAKNKKGKRKGKKKKKNQNNSPCPAGQQSCGGQCIDTYWCCINGEAKEPDCGQTCCQPGEECCGGRCVSSEVAPLCANACETPQCVPALGELRCVFAPNCQTPFGGECCVPPEKCCPLTDGTTACLKPHPACGDCMYRCPETGTLCCSTANFCGNVDNEAKCL